MKIDAVVVGAGPNGLAAAITLARAGHSVHLIEANEVIGGGARSGELTLPGFVHDLCSSVYAMATTSPFLRSLPLEQHGLEWVCAPVALAHPLDGGRAAALVTSIDETAAGLGEDGRRWRRLFEPLVSRWDGLVPDILDPRGLPSHPFAMAGFGLRAIRSARALTAPFKGDEAAALFGGIAAHAFVPLEWAMTGAFGLILGATAHASGWPFARGGAQKLADALGAILRGHGGTIETGRRVRSLDDLPPARTVLLDVTPRQLLAIAGDRLPAGARKAMTAYRYGPSAYKIDYALSGPIPWTAEACRRAAVVHVGGTFDEIAAAEKAAWDGEIPERPFVLVAQSTLADPGRAPAGRHVGWAYCHAPHGTTADLTKRLEDQIERFAPGFRDVVLARAVRSPAAFEAGNANLVGGDINGGAQDAAQLVARPWLRLDPYRTGIPGVFLCSSSTPPGGGVHGMSGHLAAKSALKWLKRGRDAA